MRPEPASTTWTWRVASKTGAIRSPQQENAAFTLDNVAPSLMMKQF
jgi:hypothetical protein